MATNQSSNLRPCPFCGGKAIVLDGARLYIIYCPNCGSSSQYFELPISDTDVEYWNTRSLEDELRAENVRLNSWLDEVIKQGNYLEHTLRLAYEHVNGHAFVHGWRDMVNHIQKEREE